MNNATNRNPAKSNRAESNPARRAGSSARRRGNPHYKSRSGKPWTGADISRLIVMAEHQVPAKRIAAKLRRSEGAVRAEATRQRVLLAPSDRIPTPLVPTSKQPYGGFTAASARAPLNRRAPSLSSARAQAPSENIQDTLF